MKKRVLSMLLAFVLCFSTLPMTAFAQEADVVTEQAGSAAEQEEQQQEEAEAAAAPGAETPADKNTTAAASGTEDSTVGEAPDTVKPTGESVSDSDAGTHDTAENGEKAAEVQAVQKLIDALPETVTEDNAESVSAQLEAIAEAMESLTEEQIAELDMEHLYAISEAMSAPMTVAAQDGTHADHPVCGTSCTDDERHDPVEWTGISSLDEITEDGYYYLKNDISLTSRWILSGKKVNLCLNGHNITNTKVDYALDIKDSAVLSLCNPHNKEAICNGVAVAAGGTFNLYDKVQITNSFSFGVYVKTGGTFIMNGGTICNNHSGVNLNGTLIMNGGSISNNKGTHFGGGVYVNVGGNFTMTGGEISGNTAEQYGGGVYVEYSTAQHKSGTFTVSGNAKIIDNKVGDSTNNVELSDGSKITIAESGLGSNASIGVTVVNSPATTGAYVTVATGKIEGSSDNFSADAGDPYGVMEQDGELVLKNGVPHIHPVCGTTCEDGEKHDSVEWTGISSLNEITEDGNYYLKNDISDVGYYWKLKYDINLCLNGHNIKTADNKGCYIDVNASNTLSLCNPHEKAASCIGVWVGDKCKFNLYDNVVITRKNNSGVWINDGGTFTMNGGTICNSSGGVVVDNNASFIMNNGRITENTMINSGGGGGVRVNAGGNFTMTGGKISENTATDYGGGVYVDFNTSQLKSGTFTVSGNAKIIDNKVGNSKNNVALCDGSKITIAESGLGSDASIGVSLKKDITEGSYAVIASGLDHGYTIDTITSDRFAYKMQQVDDELILYSRSTRLHTHPVCGKECTHTGEDAHGTLIWQGISSLDEIKEAGNYYLNNDISLSKFWEVPYDINLCLNGYQIKNTAGSDYRGYLIHMENKKLSLCNCNTIPVDKSVLNGGVFISGSDSQLDLYRNVKIINSIDTTWPNKSVVRVCGGKFTMYGGTVSGDNKYGGIYVTIEGTSWDTSGTFVMKDGTITGNSGAGVTVYGGSTVIMDGGTITGNVNGSNGGGVYVGYGTFTMNGGTISGNTSYSNGGGVYVDESSKFIMNGGTISNNKTTIRPGNSKPSSGGGVYVGYGKFIMNDGTIENNEAESFGGGIVVAKKGSFDMSGGTITDNKCTSLGSGVYLESNGTFTMKGGSITKNRTQYYTYAGGVYVAEGSKFAVSGTVNITENTRDYGGINMAENVYLQGEAENPTTITIGAGLSEASKIGVSKADYTIYGGKKIKIATGAETGVDYTKIFTADATNAEYLITRDVKGNVYLGTHQHSWVYTAKDATITLECSDCKQSGGSVTIEAPTDLVYNGGEHIASVTPSTDWQGPTVDKITVSYESEENGEFASCDTPRDSGIYRAKITVGDAVAMVTYEVKKADFGVYDFTFGSPSFREYGWGTNGYHEAKIRYAGSAKIGDITVKYYDENGKKVDRVKNAGVYTVKIDVAESKNFNAVQDLTCNYWTFVICPAILTVTPTAGQSKTYGDPDPEVFTYKISGTKFDDKPVFTGTLGRAEGKDAGTYAITLGTLALKDGANFLAKNYKLVLDETTVNFTINPKILHSTDLKPLGSTVTKVYDGTTKVNELNVVVNPAALENGDTQFKVEGTAVYNSANVAEANSVIFTPKPITEGNYRLAATEQLEVSGTLSVAITPATITVTPDDGQTKIYGEEDNLTFTSYTGAIPGETPLFTGALGREAGENVGSYVINKGTLALMNNSDGNFSAGNYTLKVSDTPVNFVITKATPVITVGDKTLVKNGVAVDISTWASFNNTDAGAKLTYELADAYEGITLEDNMLTAVNADTTAESFVMTVTAGETKNFTAPVEKRFTVKVVEKENAEVKIDAPTTKTYGDADFTLKATTKADDNGTWSWTSSNEAILEIVSGAETAAPVIRVVKADATGATLTATYISDTYYGTASVTITVNPKTVTAAMIGEVESQEYNGGAIMPTPEVKDGEAILTPGGDFEFGYSDNTNAGTATLTITGKGNYKGTADKTFTIEKKDIAGAVIELEQSEFSYNGSTQTVKIKSVTVGGKTLVSGDYSIINGSDMFMSAKDFIPLMIEGRGNYTGTATTTWKITKIDPLLDNFVVTSDLSTAQTYDGTPKAVTVQTNAVIGMGAVKVYYEGTDGTTYTRSETAPTNAGSYKVILNVAEGTNYTAAVIEAGTLKIDKAVLTLENIEKKYGFTESGEQTISIAGRVPDATGYTLGTVTGNTEIISGASVDQDGNLRFTLNEGEAGKKLTLPVTISSANYKDTTVDVVIIQEYRIIDGANSSWTQNTDGTIVIRGNGAYRLFREVKVDGNIIDAANYEVKEGSTIITLKAEYLKTLAAGSHTFEIVWNDGSAGTDFTVVVNTPSNNGNSSNNDSSDNSSGDSSNTTDIAAPAANNPAQELDKVPATGDPFGIWLTLFAVSLAGLAAMLVRKKNNRE